MDLDVDAVLIGAGFSGLYMLRKLRDELGLSATMIERGDGVGGTWHWNRYPGANSDSDSYIYGFMFDEDLWHDWGGPSAIGAHRHPVLARARGRTL